MLYRRPFVSESAIALWLIFNEVIKFFFESPLLIQFAANQILRLFYRGIIISKAKWIYFKDVLDPCLLLCQTLFGRLAIYIVPVKIPIKISYVKNSTVLSSYLSP